MTVHINISIQLHFASLLNVRSYVSLLFLTGLQLRCSVLIVGFGFGLLYVINGLFSFFFFFYKNSYNVQGNSLGKGGNVGML